TTPGTTQPRPPATTLPVTPSTPATAQPISPTLRAELESSLSNELAGSPFATQTGQFGTEAVLSSGGMPQMIGDLGPLPRTSSLPSPCPPPRPPGVPGGARGATLVIPAIRDIKISEDQSPRPQDRVFFMFNYFQGVNDQVNQRLHAPIGYTQVFRYIG